jgi:hypothetical protein
MVRAIARATVEQAKGSKQVTDAIGRIAETVQQIAAATAEQARGLGAHHEERREDADHHAARRAQLPGAGARRAADHERAIESISNMVNQLNSSHHQRRHQRARRLVEGRLLQLLQKVVRAPTGHQHARCAGQPAQQRDLPSTHLHQLATHAQLGPQRAPLRGKHVRHRHAPCVERHRHRLRIERVVLATVLADTDLLDPGRVQHHRLLVPPRQHVVHMPPLPARLERHLRRGRLGPQHRLELFEPANAGSTHHHAVGHLAIGDVACTQIQSYAPHD